MPRKKLRVPVLTHEHMPDGRYGVNPGMSGPALPISGTIRLSTFELRSGSTLSGAEDEVACAYNESTVDILDNQLNWRD